MIGDLRITVSRFSTAFPKGPAIGTMETTTWPQFAASLMARRIGEKDGQNFIPATFRPEPDGSVRRLKSNVATRTAIALDLEVNPKTGEVPPPLTEAAERLKGKGWGAALYTSHSHDPKLPRYRIVLPLSDEIQPELPAPECIAAEIGVLGVLDRSKIGASSVFYLPSCAPGQMDLHDAEIVVGEPICAAWLQERAGAILEAREAERERQRAEVMDAAAGRAKERARQGVDASTDIIAKVRDRLDITVELIAHDYRPAGKNRFLYSESQTGVAGVFLLTGGDGVERVYSHHAADPLAPGNAPAGFSKAHDAVDVVAILDHGGDLKAALRTMAKRFGLETSRPASTQEPPPPTGYDVPDEENAHAATDYGEIGNPAEIPKASASDADPPRTTVETILTESADLPESNKPFASPAAPPRPAIKVVRGEVDKLVFVDPCTLDGKPIPERRWIVAEWLPVGVVTLNYGDGGTGKTLLAQQLMTSCATGTAWCGLHVEPCISLGIFCEDDPDELHRRQARINAALGVQFADLANMRWASGVGLDNLLVTFDADHKIKFTERLGEIEDHAAKIKASLVVLDTGADLFGGNENDRTQVRQFVGMTLGGMAKRLGAVVLLNVHPSRSGMSATGDHDGGSTAWSNTSRSRWSLSRLPMEGDTPADTDERILTRRKANYASIGETIKLRWSNGVLIPLNHRAGLGGSSEAAWGAPVDEVFLVLLDRCAAQAVFVSHSKNSGNFAPKIFAKRPDRSGFTAKEFEAAMHRLLAAKRIRAEEYRGKGRSWRARLAVEGASNDAPTQTGEAASPTEGDV